MPDEDVGKIVAELVLNDKQFRASLTSALKASGGFEKDTKGAFGSVGKSFSSMSSRFIGQAAAMGTAYLSFRAIVGAGRDIEETFMKIETMQADIATLGPEAKASLGLVNDSLSRLSLETHKLPTDLLAGYYQAVSAGSKAGAEALELVRVAGLTAGATLSSTATNVDVLTSYMNAFGPRAISAAAAADMMAVAVQRGKIRMGEIASEIGDVFPFMNTFKLQLQDATAFLETLTNAGFNAATATTTLKNMLAQFLAKADDFKAANIDIFKVMEEEGLLGGIKALQKATGGSISEMQKFIPEIRALQGVLALTGENQAKFIAAQDAAVKSAGTVRDMAAEQAKTQASAFTDLKSAWELFAKSVGEKAKPVAEALMGVTAAGLRGLTPSAGTSQESIDVLRIASERNDGAIPTAGTLVGIQNEIKAANELNKTLMAESVQIAKNKELAIAAANEKTAAINIANDKEFAATVNLLKNKNQQEQEAMWFAVGMKKLEVEEKVFWDKYELEGIETAWKQKQEFIADDLEFSNEILRLKAETEAEFNQKRLEAFQLANQVDADLTMQQQQTDYDMAVADFERKSQANKDHVDQKTLLEQAYLDNTLMARQSWQTNMDLLASQSIATFKNSASAGLTDMAMGLKTAQQAGNDLFNSLKRGVISFAAEWLVQSALLKTKQVVDYLFFGTANKTLAATTAASWAPAAALVSLASFGANAIPANAGIAATTAAAYLAAIPKMHSGGEVTGSGEQLRVLEPGEQVSTAANFEVLKDAILSLGNRSQVVVLRGGDAATQKLLDLLQIEIRDNGKAFAATEII